MHFLDKMEKTEYTNFFKKRIEEHQKLLDENPELYEDNPLTRGLALDKKRLEELSSREYTQQINVEGENK